MTKGKIAITPRSATKVLHPALNLISEAGYELLIPSPGEVPTAEIQNSFAGEIVGYLAGVEKIDASFLRNASNLRVISRNGTGIDNIDLISAEHHGIKVVNAPTANSQGVAELAIGLIFVGARNILQSAQGIREGKWERSLGFELSGKTLGLVGCGQIGQRVALAALGIGMRVTAFDAYPSEKFAPSPHFTFDTLEQVLENADVVSLHCPPSETPIINEASIDTMKVGAILVNTARASLVETVAVGKALEGGKLSGYICDVFDPEPPKGFPLVNHPRFIGTSHIGGFTRESVDRAMYQSVENLIKALEE